MCAKTMCDVCGQTARWRLKQWQVCEEPSQCSRLLLAQLNNGDTEDLPPAFIVDAIRARFSPQPFPPDFLTIRTSHIAPAGRGVFATQRILRGWTLVTYGGTVLFTEAARDQRDVQHASDKVFTFNVWDRTIYVDGRVRPTDPNQGGSFTSWPALINHQWEWPTADKLPITDQWYPVFANCDVLQNGDNVGAIVAIRDIEEGEEISIDYGKAYWQPFGRRREAIIPDWNWGALPQSTGAALERYIKETGGHVGDWLRSYKKSSNIVGFTPTV